MESQKLSEKMVIPSKIKVDKTQEILDNLNWISDNDIQNISDSVKDKWVEVQDKVKAEYIVERLLKHQVKIKENVDYGGFAWDEVHLKIWWHEFNYFVSYTKSHIVEGGLSSALRSYCYSSLQISNLRLYIVKHLLSCWVEQNQIFPWSIYVELLKKALKLDDWFWLWWNDAKKGPYWVDCKSRGITVKAVDDSVWGARFLIDLNKHVF